MLCKKNMAAYYVQLQLSDTKVDKTKHKNSCFQSQN